MDFGKFKYESAMKAREARKNQAHTVLKEIRLRLKIDPHDYGTKKGHVERFLKAGDKVKVMIMFRGREQSRPELGYRLLQRMAEDVKELGYVESSPKQDGRNMIMVIGPNKKKADAKAEPRPEPKNEPRRRRVAEVSSEQSTPEQSAAFLAALSADVDELTAEDFGSEAPTFDVVVAETETEAVAEAPVAPAEAPVAPVKAPVAPAAAAAPAAPAAASASTRPAPRPPARPTSSKPATPRASGPRPSTAPRPTSGPRPSTTGTTGSTPSATTTTSATTTSAAAPAPSDDTPAATTERAAPKPGPRPTPRPAAKKTTAKSSAEA